MDKNIIKEVAAKISKRAEALELEEKLDGIKEMLAEHGLGAKKVEEKKTNPLVIVLAIVGAVAFVALIAYAVFHFLMPEDSEYFEDFDEDDFLDEEDDEDWEE